MEAQSAKERVGSPMINVARRKDNNMGTGDNHGTACRIGTGVQPDGTPQ